MYNVSMFVTKDGAKTTPWDTSQVWLLLVSPARSPGDVVCKVGDRQSVWAVAPGHYQYSSLCGQMSMVCCLMSKPEIGGRGKRPGDSQKKWWLQFCKKDMSNVFLDRLIDIRRLDFGSLLSACWTVETPEDNSSDLNQYSWAKRGWCRAEKMARELSDRHGLVLMIDSPEHLTLLPAAWREEMCFPLLLFLQKQQHEPGKKVNPLLQFVLEWAY